MHVQIAAVCQPLKAMLTARLPDAMLPRESSLTRSAVLAFIILPLCLEFSAISDPSVCFRYGVRLG